jgi:hypothetical protein
MPNISKVAFNSGEVSPKVYGARFDVEKYQRACISLQNMFPTKYGSAERRPGTIYLNSSYNNKQVVRLLPFIYSSVVVYKVEATDKNFRFYFEDDVLQDGGDVTIATPYLETSLFELQYYQIGDVLWIVHPAYKQRKLIRTSPTAFEINEIDFRKGPFLTRNDLLDPDNPSTQTMKCTVTGLGAVGTLSTTNPTFEQGHVGALFNLTHPIGTTIVTAGAGGTSGVLEIKGTLSFITHGTWSGTVKLQRRDNKSDWENFRTYKSSDDQNVRLAYTENDDSIEYRVNANGVSGDFSGDLSTDQSNRTGIVRVDAVINAYAATVTVVKRLESTATTTRWAEGSWSGVRGFPSTVTFFEDRCVYAGASTGQAGDVDETTQYPALRRVVGA